MKRWEVRSDKVLQGFGHLARVSHHSKTIADSQNDNFASGATFIGKGVTARPQDNCNYALLHDLQNAVTHQHVHLQVKVPMSQAAEAPKDRVFFHPQWFRFQVLRHTCNRSE